MQIKKSGKVLNTYDNKATWICCIKRIMSIIFKDTRKGKSTFAENSIGAPQNRNNCWCFVEWLIS